MRLLSRSSHEAYCRCPRRFYYTYEFQRTGIVPRVTPFDLGFGLSVHKGLEVLLTQDFDVEAAVGAAHREWAPLMVGHLPELQEQAYHLMEALIWGWWKYMLPTFLDEWELVSVEKEGRCELAPGVVLQYRPDVVARSKEDGLLYVWNWKTASSGYGWTEKWAYDIQMWTEALAVERELGEPVRGCIVEGLIKGSRKVEHIFSPLLWAHRCPADNGGGWVYSTEAKRPSGASPWGRFATWRDENEYPGGLTGLRGWLNFLPPHQVAANFVRSDVLRRPEGVVEAWIQQVCRIEKDIEYVMKQGTEEERLAYFWQNFSPWNCKGCAFEPLCGGRRTVEDMLEAGEYMPRVDHHGGYGGGGNE